jgi:hypothetical protein
MAIEMGAKFTKFKTKLKATTTLFRQYVLTARMPLEARKRNIPGTAIKNTYKCLVMAKLALFTGAQCQT